MIAILSLYNIYKKVKKKREKESLSEQIKVLT